MADQDPGGPDLAAISLSRARASRRALPQRRTAPRSSGSGPDERDPQLLSSALDRLLVERGWEHSRIEDAIGRGVVGRIRILGPSAPSWRAGQRRVPGRGPRDTYG